MIRFTYRYEFVDVFSNRRIGGGWHRNPYNGMASPLKIQHFSFIEFLPYGQKQKQKRQQKHRRLTD